MYNADGRKCVGEFVNDKLEGRGTVYNPDGSLRFEGLFQSDIAIGQGTFYYPDGRKYVGNFENNKQEG